MKSISLLSAAFLSTLFLSNGFSENVQESQSKKTEPYQILANKESSPSSYKNASPDGPPIPPNRDLSIHSAHGCLNQGFSLESEFLWWRAILDNLDYGLENSFMISNPDQFPLGRPYQFRIKEPKFEFDPGFRVSIGYDFGRDNWDLFLRWTYHHTHPTDFVNSKAEHPIFLVTRVEPLALTRNFGAIALSPHGRVEWDLHFNVLDFEMGYDYFFSRRFSIRPHMGIKTALIDMDYHVEYNNTKVFEGSNNRRNLDAKGESDYWGVGPCFGIDNYLHMGAGFSLYGKLAGAALYGQFDTRYNQFQIENPANMIEIRVNIKQEDFFRLRSTAQMGLGLEWAYCFSREFLLALHLGWETQYWWNQLEMPFFGFFKPDGDLTFSGLDVGVRFDF